MAITASMVKELREMTGAGMMDCKKALNETNGDMDAAVEFLRKNGLLDTGGTSSGAWYGGYASKEQTKLDANEKKSSSGKNMRT